MNDYKFHPNLPKWIVKMDGELLTRAQLDILDLIYARQKHGCRNSNDRIAGDVHCSHSTAQIAVIKFLNLQLVEIGDYGKRTRVIRTTAWPDRQAWEKRADCQEHFPQQGAQNAPHISKADRGPLARPPALLSAEPTEAAGDFYDGGKPPKPPICGSVGKAQPTPNPPIETVHFRKEIQRCTSSAPDPARNAHGSPESKKPSSNIANHPQMQPGESCERSETIRQPTIEGRNDIYFPVDGPGQTW